MSIKLDRDEWWGLLAGIFVLLVIFVGGVSLGILTSPDNVENQIIQTNEGRYIRYEGYYYELVPRNIKIENQNVVIHPLPFPLKDTCSYTIDSLKCSSTFINSCNEE